MGWDVYSWHKRIEFDSGGNFCFVCKEFDLRDVHTSLELNYNLLRINAKALAVPPIEIVWISGVGCEFSHSVSCVLARAMEHFEVENRFP